MNIEKSILENLSILLNKRAREKGMIVDEKFRNIYGLSMQIRCIHHIATTVRKDYQMSVRFFLLLTTY